MIRYQLVCSHNHTFEAWFASSEAFDKQASANLVACPTCGDTTVRKAIMAPNVSPQTRRRGSVTDSAESDRPVVDEGEQGVSAPVPAAMANAEAVAEAAKAVAFMRAVRSAVEKNAEHVGPRFAEEARKIHYGETDAKPIYGEATRNEATELVEEGIEFMPLPVLPEDRN